MRSFLSLLGLGLVVSWVFIPSFTDTETGNLSSYFEFNPGLSKFFIGCAVASFLGALGPGRILSFLAATVVGLLSVFIYGGSRYVEDMMAREITYNNRMMMPVVGAALLLLASIQKPSRKNEAESD